MPVHIPPMTVVQRAKARVAQRAPDDVAQDTCSDLNGVEVPPREKLEDVQGRIAELHGALKENDDRLARIGSG